MMESRNNRRQDARPLEPATLLPLPLLSPPLISPPLLSPQSSKSSAAPLSSAGSTQKIETVNGNIFNQNVEALVNPWNSNLFRGWLRPLHLALGLAGQMKVMLGTEPFRQLSSAGRIPIGGAVLTSAGDRAPYLKAIIHVAGSRFVWGSNEQIVRDSVKSALRLAGEHGITSIAFPLIGSGHGKVRSSDSNAWISDEISKSDFKGRAVIVTFAPEPFKPRENDPYLRLSPLRKFARQFLAF